VACHDIMLNRFLRTFLIAGISLIIFASFLFIHPSSRAFIDPFTGELFGEGGFEPNLSSSPDVDKDALKGGVIMAKLGNETAK
jgi:FAD-linked sulfhydryl oxidase